MLTTIKRGLTILIAIALTLTVASATLIPSNEPRMVERTEEDPQTEVTETTEAEEAQEEPAEKEMTYTIQPGDDWYKIAAKLYGETWYYLRLCYYNDINIRDWIYAGVVIKVPSMEEILAIEVPIQYQGDNLGYRWYTIQPGEDWYSIATKFFGGPEDYMKLVYFNNIDVNEWIYAGVAIKIPSAETLEKIQLPTSYYQKSGQTKNYVGWVDTSNFTYIGTYRTTGYDPHCAHCCGKTNGITASGTHATPGRTAAIKGYPYGTEIYIEGYGFYINEDTGGFSRNIIDLAVNSHAEANSITRSGLKVYLVN